MRKLKFRAFYQNSVIKGIFDVDIIDFKDNLITLRHKDNANDIEMVDLDAVRLLQDTGLKELRNILAENVILVKQNSCLYYIL